ncbi:cell division protein ZapE [Embleya sp. NBC_00888]|uniref:cell division protein ZapE n=1 Tax=Embleya sp. NBC_00888 TaxID=2975960 RepID=UPI0038652331|nr:cell division protein ZapE [Embleya sp. NBC_00888]
MGRTTVETMRGHFHETARARGYLLDAAQEQAADRLAELGAALGRGRGHGLFHRRPAAGLYLWGPVGRGKTWLLDTFFAAVPLPAERRTRVHFHAFFRRLHEAVRRHRDDHGHERSAVDAAVSELVGDVDLLCFDEFHVHDPGDAMLVTRLLRELHARGVVLVCTSNYPPAGLLPNPLYHHLFEPTIREIQARMTVVTVAGPRDYRSLPRTETLDTAFARGAVLWPGDPEQLRGQQLVPPTPDEAVTLRVNHRELAVAAARPGELWSGFAALCEGRTSPLDYLVLAETYPTWVLGGLPALKTASAEARQRFVNLVDVCCDADVRLFLCSDRTLTEILAGDDLPTDITRTASRLGLLRRVDGSNNGDGDGGKSVEGAEGAHQGGGAEHSD